MTSKLAKPSFTTTEAREIDVYGLSCHEITGDDKKILSENAISLESPFEDYPYLSERHIYTIGENCMKNEVFDPSSRTRDLKVTDLKPSVIKKFSKEIVPLEKPEGDGGEASKKITKVDRVSLGYFSFGGGEMRELLEVVSAFPDFNPDKVSILHANDTNIPASVVLIDSNKKEYVRAAIAPLILENPSKYKRLLSMPACDPETASTFLDAFRDDWTIPLNVFVSREFSKASAKRLPRMDFLKASREILLEPFLMNEDEDGERESIRLGIKELGDEYHRADELIGYIGTCGNIPDKKECNDRLCLIPSLRPYRDFLISKIVLDEGKGKETCSPWKEAHDGDYSREQINEDIQSLALLTRMSQKDIKSNLSICDVPVEEITVKKFVTNDIVAYKGHEAFLKKLLPLTSDEKLGILKDGIMKLEKSRPEMKDIWIELDHCNFSEQDRTVNCVVNTARTKTYGWDQLDIEEF